MLNDPKGTKITPWLRTDILKGVTSAQKFAGFQLHKVQGRKIPLLEVQCGVFSNCDPKGAVWLEALPPTQTHWCPVFWELDKGCLNKPPYKG